MEFFFWTKTHVKDFKTMKKGCVNDVHQEFEIMYEHLVVNGMVFSYTI